jgi:hypothetical protein
MNPTLISGLILGMSMAWAHAGPCSSEISKIEQAVNQPNSMVGPTARQSVGAQLDRQPTPSSVAAAEQRADTHYADVLNKAKTLDAANNSDCKKVVDELKLLVGMK